MDTPDHQMCHIWNKKSRVTPALMFSQRNNPYCELLHNKYNFFN